MAEEYQAPLSFLLKEAVWFKKGQGVADLLSIELNPQIGIEEEADYVQVKGTLELYGEYNKKETETPFSLRDFSQTKIVGDVTKREDGIYVFTHYFPVDITIPKTKVRDVEDIYVLVDSFDYELPESNALQIIAELSITGLYEEEKHKEFVEEKIVEQGIYEEGEYETTTDTTLGDTFEEFAFEARKSPTEEEPQHLNMNIFSFQEEVTSQRVDVDSEQEEVEEHPNIKPFSFQEEATSQSVDVDSGQEEVEEHPNVESFSFQEEVTSQSVDVDSEQEEVEEHPNVKLFSFQEEVTSQSVDIDSEQEEVEEHPNVKLFSFQEEVTLQSVDVDSEQEEIEEHSNVKLFSLQEEADSQSLDVEAYFNREVLSRQASEEETLDNSAVESQEEDEIQEETAPRPEENALYLTRIFGRGEEKFRKVCMYIVQSGDTLESIAEKYEIQIQQITRRNQLEELYVTEGQILYLPTKKSNS